MKMTLTTYDIADTLLKDEYANWSRAGARAIAEFLEEYEDSSGEETELDVVEIRCDFSEYGSLQEWADEYFTDKAQADDAIGFDAETDDEDERGEKIREYIQDNFTLIEFDGGIIVSSF